MIKYRCLSKDELDELQQEFLKFLLVQNIYPEQWENLKMQNTDKAHEQIELFSNIVFDKILSETTFLELISGKRIECYQFNKESAQLLALQANENNQVDFVNQTLTEISPNEYHIYSGTKKYKNDRNSEVFYIMQKGAVKTDGTLFKKIALLMADSCFQKNS